jgi:hypothetical protein
VTTTTAPPAPSGGKLSKWIETHKQQAGFGGAAVAVIVLVIAKKHKSSAAAGGAASPATSTMLGTAVPGGIGVPGTSASDIQNAVQDQINSEISGVRTEISGEISRIPAGAKGATGARGATGPAGPRGTPVVAVKPKPTAAQIAKNKADHLPTLAAIDANRKAHKLPPLTAAQIANTPHKPTGPVVHRPAPTPPPPARYPQGMDKYGRPL